MKNNTSKYNSGQYNSGQYKSGQYNSGQYKSGFTLLELALVLVIIALLSGGILLSRSLIRNSELKAVITERSVYTKALKEFSDRYTELPGDFANATTMWGTDADGCPNFVYSSTPPEDTKTCNGNGDGRIGTTTKLGIVTDENEWWRAWQHLANAGLIDGRYTGVPGNFGKNSSTPGINTPASKLTPGGWSLHYFQLVTIDTVSMYKETLGGWGHILYFAPATNAVGNQDILTPKETFGLDRKIDDGKPGTGTVRTARRGLLPNCTENDTSKENQTYKTSYAGPACSLLFLLGI